MYILGLRLDNGQVQPIARSKNKVSNKGLKRLLNKFKKDRDVVGLCCLSWERLYSRKAETYELPEV